MLPNASENFNNRKDLQTANLPLPVLCNKSIRKEHRKRSDRIKNTTLASSKETAMLLLSHTSFLKKIKVLLIKKCRFCQAVGYLSQD